MLHVDDTIAAIASPAGVGARGIVRVSGPQVVAVVAHCFRAQDGVPLSSWRRAAFVRGAVQLPCTRAAELPADLLLWPTARSYTRQPLAELHLLGSPPLVSAVLAALVDAGARLAQPGEFTLRAFLAGRLDLAQAEAVLGVIDAHDAEQLETALAQLAGGLTRPLAQLRESLLALLAHLEAGLDFVDEDIQFIRPQEIQRQLDEAVTLVAQTIRQLQGRTQRDALPKVVLTGAPNVGKSSLFNALAGGSALVADMPGTTRDYLAATLDLEGIGCRLIDTAGLMENGALPTDRAAVGLADTIGGTAQEHAAAQAAQADLLVECLDALQPRDTCPTPSCPDNLGPRRLVVWTKCDRPLANHPAAGTIATSSFTGLGLAELRNALRRALVELPRDDAGPQMTADRCSASLLAAGEALARAAELNAATAGDELIGSELRLALAELSTVVGAVYTDDILDRIFSRFCIGK
ncbi:MAG: tRNA modification GTPase [Pirellulales bacterium]